MTKNDFPKLIGAFPRQLLAGLSAAREAAANMPPFRPRRPISHLVFCGMGGSALPALLLRDFIRSDTKLARRHLHIVVHRDYGLPPEALTSSALILITSYSGNTEEALSSYRAARRHRLPVIAIASGGSLAQQAKRDHVALARINRGLPPRFAVGEQFSAALGLLIRLGFLPISLERKLSATASLLKPSAFPRKAHRIAKLLQHRIPLIYASDRNEALAYIWKIQMNESAKIPAFANVFPELNHNEMNSYAMLTNTQSALRKMLAVVMLHDARDRSSVKKRMRVTSSLITRSGVPVIPVALSGRHSLTRTFNGFLLGEWVAGIRARSYGVDPLPTNLIEEFKRRLRP